MKTYKINDLKFVEIGGRTFVHSPKSDLPQVYNKNLEEVVREYKKMINMNCKMNIWNDIVGFVKLEVLDEETILCPQNPYQEQGTLSGQDWIKCENAYYEVMDFVDANQEELCSLIGEEYLTIRNGKIIPMNEKLYVKDANYYDDKYEGCDERVFGSEIILYKFICQDPKDDSIPKIYINDNFTNNVETYSNMKTITFSCDVDGTYVRVHNPENMVEDMDEVQQIIDNENFDAGDFEEGEQVIINGTKITFMDLFFVAILSVDGWLQHPYTYDYAIKHFYGDI